MEPVRVEVHHATPPRDTGNYPNYRYESNVFPLAAEDARWDPSLFMTDNAESTYGEFIIQIDESPTDSATPDPPQALYPSGMDVRRYSDNTSDRPSMPSIRRSVSHQDIPPIQTRNNLYPYYDNAIWSPPTPSSSSLGVPSPYVAHGTKPFPDGYSDVWDSSQTMLQQTVQTAPPSPDPQLLSPLSDTSSRFDLSPEPTRGRGRRSSSVHRHSPYIRSRSVSRMTTDMGHLSITGTSPSSPNPPYQQYFASDHLLEHDPTLPDLHSFEDVMNGSGPPGVYAPEVQSPFGEVQSPFGEDVVSLFKDDCSPVEQHISPLASQSGFRPKVGSEAIERAASGRRKRPGEFLCTISGCSATFTAKHNLQNHLNSHMGIRNYKCNTCSRDFGTPHVLTRHMKKCNGKKKRVMDS